VFQRPEELRRLGLLHQLQGQPTGDSLFQPLKSGEVSVWEDLDKEKGEDYTRDEIATEYVPWGSVLVVRRARSFPLARKGHGGFFVLKFSNELMERWRRIESSSITLPFKPVSHETSESIG
jgi:hypothetical protein